MESREFTVKHLNLPLRIKSTSGIHVLAIMSMPTRTVTQNESYIKAILETCEVQIAGKWLPLKEEGIEVYYPEGLEDNIPVMNEIGDYFSNKFLKSVFPKSNESIA